MKVIEVIIDVRESTRYHVSTNQSAQGFKSYAVRTVISGWDATFNSITGLNGSGKSNILDAICFVLGITNMSTVRAQNLQDLIYKRGQAGVTKASVTIVFDNNDKSNSPIGFEEYAQISVTRQIILGGTSKYLVNGHRAQQATVQNLFQSVGLNINNPNFLIMQGRITKVLNMKPAEILAMIEEAAGTRMFEDRKEKANKTMAKKEMKVHEIESLLKEEIEPKLEKLRGEKRAWLDYQKTQGELERLTRVVVASDYVRSGEKMKLATEEHDTKRTKVRHLEDNGNKLKREIDNIEEEVKRIRSVREKEMRKGGRFQDLAAEVKRTGNELVRLSTVLDLKKGSIAEEETQQKELTKSIKELQKHVSQRSKALDVVQVQWNAAKTALETHSTELEQKEELLSTLQTGVASKAGQEGGYQGQLHEARDRANAAATEQEQAKLKITHLEKRLKEDRPKAEKAKKQNANLLDGLSLLRKEAAALEAEIAKVGYQPGREEELRQREIDLRKSVRRLSEQTDVLKRKVANVDFNYHDPSPNFDRSKVKGLVAQLFTLNKENIDAATALEICAGGRLYNVVVDTAETGSQLLQNGKLKKRVTIIPLNKISSFKASPEKIGAAQKLAPGKANIALSLVGYDKDVAAAMDFVFGTTLICEDAETAKKVTFDPAVRLKSVTLQGDVYDPAGTLSGGSAPTSSGILVTLQKLNEVTQELNAAEEELAHLQKLIEDERQGFGAAKQAKQALDLKMHEVKLSEDQINGNSSSSIIQAVEETSNTITQLKEAIEQAKQQITRANQDIKRIEKDMADFSSNKNSKLEELEQSLASLKTQSSEKSSQVKQLQKALQEAKIEAEQASNDVITAQEQLAEIGKSISSLKSELGNLRKEETVIKDSNEVALAELADEQAKLSGFDEELRDLEATKSRKAKQVTEESLEIQRLSHAVDKAQKDLQTASQTVDHLEKEHEWIADNKDQFGKPGTAYDFQGKNLSECRATLKNVTEQFQGMKKKINPKVMPMIDSVEKKEASLKNMLRTVVRDKRKIEETICTLDEYKREALMKTWKQVTEDFGNIFADLLPGNNTAKLVPLDDNINRIQEGLEVKVCLGKIWKQSLNELSGGQR